MMKFTAKTHVALNVVLPSGKNMHISFTPITGGGSVFYTNDPSVAQALEGHYKFGHLFKKVDEPKVVQAKATAKPETKVEANVATESSAKVEKKKDRTLTFACYEDAKDYLVETFGVSRTKLRTQKAIEDMAIANNVKLVISD